MKTVRIYYRLGVPPSEAEDIKFSPALYRKVWELKRRQVTPDDMWALFNDEEYNPLISHQDIIEKSGLRHTSMSIGDVVEIDKTKFIVTSSGWRII